MSAKLAQDERGRRNTRHARTRHETHKTAKVWNKKYLTSAKPLTIAVMQDGRYGHAPDKKRSGKGERSDRKQVEIMLVDHSTERVVIGARQQRRLNGITNASDRVRCVERECKKMPAII